MAISYVIHLKSGTQCVIKFDVDSVTAADVRELIRSTSGEIHQRLWVDNEEVAAIEVLNAT